MVFKPGVPLQPPSTDLLTWAQSLQPGCWDSPIYIDAHDTKRSISRGGAFKLIRQLAAGLTALGVKPGECVVIHARNDIFIPILSFACASIGAVFMPTSIAAAEPELVQIFSLADVKWAFAEQAFADLVKAAMTKAGGNPIQCLLFDDPLASSNKPSGTQSLSSLFDFGESSHLAFDDAEKARTLPVMYSATSGTTGTPKVVQAPHTYMTYTSLGRIIYMDGPQKDYEIKFIHSVPLFHVSGWQLALEVLAGTGTLYLSKTSVASELCELYEQLQITDSYMSPKLMHDLVVLVESGAMPASRLQSLRSVGVAGAPGHPPTAKKFKALSGGRVQIWSAYGSTELGGAACLPYPEEPKGDVFPLGRNFPGVSFMLLDPETGEEITSYETPGDLYVSSPGCFISYLKNDAATAEGQLLRDGSRWIRTGDMGYIAEHDREWRILGRTADMFRIFRGSAVHAIAPKRIEDVLLSVDGIVDAAVGPALNEHGLAEVCAWIKVKPAVQKEGLFGMFKAVLDEIDQPTKVVFVDEIPRNASGKILRGKLGSLTDVRSD